MADIVSFHEFDNLRFVRSQQRKDKTPVPSSSVEDEDEPVLMDYLLALLAKPVLTTEDRHQLGVVVDYEPESLMTLADCVKGMAEDLKTRVFRQLSKMDAAQREREGHMEPEEALVLGDLLMRLALKLGEG